MIGILHLSDFHFHKECEYSSNFKSKVDEIRKAICGVVNSHTLHIDTLLVVVSGDIAFSGLKEEYKIAEEFFNQLKSEIQSESEIEAKFFYIPGNHDNDYKLLSDGQQSIPDTEHPAYVERSIIQREFGVFLINMNSSVFDLAKPINAIPLKIDNYTLKINLINTGLYSSLKNSSTEQYFPTNSLIQLESDQSSADLVISIMHHPIYSFMENIRHEVKVKLENTTDILLVGHEHVSDYSGVTGFSDSHINIINGEEIDIDQASSSCFNFLIVDVGNDELTTIKYEWDSNRKMFLESNRIDKQTLFNPKRKQFSKTITNEFLGFLQDPGGPFLKLKSGKLTLKDIFVYPPIAVTSQDDIRPKELPILEGTDVLEEVLKHRVVLIAGSDYSGKTTLSKMLYYDILNGGKFPLFMLGESISSAKIDYLDNLIKKKYSEVYTRPDINAFLQEPKGNKVLILDDFEKVKLNTTRRIELIENLLNFFNTIIIMSSEVIDPEFSSTITLMKKNGTKSLVCRIKPFGNVQISKIVGKWLEASQDELLNDIVQRKIEVERVLHDILDRRLLPAYPFFVASILQTIVFTNAENNSSSAIYYGSYSAIYRLLITTATLRNIPPNLDMNVVDQLQQNLAYKMFTENSRSCSEQDIYSFTNEFLASRLVNAQSSTIVDHLLINRLWDIRDNKYGFAYDFIYYYYLASYFQEHIHETNIITQASACFDCIGNERNKSIIRFLVYVANSQVQQILFSKLIEKAESLYAGSIPLNLPKQTHFINDIKIVLPTERLEKKPEENRVELLKKRDDLEDALVDDEDSEESQENNSWVEIIEALNTLLLLGDLLKNQIGTLDKNQKIDLVNESFELISRILSSGLNFFAEERETLEDFIISYLSDLAPAIPDSEKKEKTRIMLAQMIYMYTLSVFSLLREYIGHENLNLVFTEVRNNKKFEDVPLLDFVVRLNPSFHDFPESELYTVLRQYHRSSFIKNIIAMITFEFISIYPTDYKILARVSRKLGIKLPKPRL